MGSEDVNVFESFSRPGGRTVTAGCISISFTVRYLFSKGLMYLRREPATVQRVGGPWN